MLVTCMSDAVAWSLYRATSSVSPLSRDAPDGEPWREKAREPATPGVVIEPGLATTTGAVPPTGVHEYPAGQATGVIVTEPAVPLSFAIVRGPTKPVAGRPTLAWYFTTAA